MIALFVLQAVKNAVPDTSTYAVVSMVIGAVNLLVLLGIAFKGGHWMGRVEVRLEQLEKLSHEEQ